MWGDRLLCILLPIIPFFFGIFRLWLLTVIQAVLLPKLLWLSSPWVVPSSPLQESFPQSCRIPAVRNLQSILSFPHNHRHNRLCFNLNALAWTICFSYSTAGFKDSTTNIISTMTLHSDVSQACNTSLIITKIQCPNTSNL